jgi:hypothetical protein
VTGMMSDEVSLSIIKYAFDLKLSLRLVRSRVSLLPRNGSVTIAIPLKNRDTILDKKFTFVRDNQDL